MEGQVKYDVAEICRALPGTPPTKKTAGEMRDKLYKKCRAYIENFMDQPNTPSRRYPGGVKAKRRLVEWAGDHGREHVIDLCVDWLVERARQAFEEGSDED